MSNRDLETVVRRRLADETGRISKQAPMTVALAYPSPYGAAMSSLGYQRIYRAIMETSGLACERVFLDDEADRGERGLRAGAVGSGDYAGCRQNSGLTRGA